MTPSSEVRPNRIPNPIVNFLKGMLMGMAMIIPGVSGGTMALITGIFERLIRAIKAIDLRFLTLSLRGDREGARENVRAMDLPLLAPLLVGLLCAIVILARGLRYLLDEHAGPTFGFFFGLILASAVFVSRYVDEMRLRHVASGALGFAIVFFIQDLGELTASDSTPAILLAGAIAMCAMILPGISGSLMLLVLGQYDAILDAVNSRDLYVLAVFALGGAIGLALFARLLDYMIERHRSVTMVFLFGLMLGALRVPAVEIWIDTDPSSVPSVVILLVCTVLGLLLVFFIEHLSGEVVEGPKEVG